MSTPFQSIPIMHLDLTSPRGRQCLQDALDQLVAMFSGGRIDTKHLTPTLQTTLAGLGSPARAVYLRSANQSIANNTATFIAWDTQVDNYRLPDPDATGAINLGPEFAGRRFMVVFNVRWAAGATGYRQCEVGHWGSNAGAATRKKTGNDIRMAVTTASLNTDQNVVLITDPVEPGDQILCLVRHTQGSALDVSSNGGGTFQRTTSLSIHELT
jgi:hypothetical protein